MGHCTRSLVEKLKQQPRKLYLSLVFSLATICAEIRVCKTKQSHVKLGQDPTHVHTWARDSHAAHIILTGRSTDQTKKMSTMSGTKNSCLKLLGCSAAVPVDWIRDRHSDAFVVDIGVRAEMIGRRIVDRLVGGDLPHRRRRSFCHSGNRHVHVVSVARSGVLPRSVVRHAAHVGIAGGGVDTDIFLESS